MEQTYNDLSADSATLALVEYYPPIQPPSTQVNNKFSKTVKNVQGAGIQLTDAIQKINEYKENMKSHIKYLERSPVLKGHPKLQDLLIERQRRALNYTIPLIFDWNMLMDRFKASNPSFVPSTRPTFVLSVLQDMPRRIVPPFKDIVMEQTYNDLSADSATLALVEYYPPIQPPSTQVNNKFSKTVKNVQGAGIQLTDAIQKINEYKENMKSHIKYLERSPVLKGHPKLQDLLIERQRRALNYTIPLIFDWNMLMDRFKASNPSFVPSTRPTFVLSVLQDMPHRIVPPFTDILPKRTEFSRLRVPPSRFTRDRAVGHPASQEKEGDLITSLI